MMDNKEWFFCNAFTYAGNDYITWIKESGGELGGPKDAPGLVHHFKHKTVLATKQDIEEAKNTIYYTKIKL